jgi:hypothetical protein
MRLGMAIGASLTAEPWPEEVCYALINTLRSGKRKMEKHCLSENWLSVSL